MLSFPFAKINLGLQIIRKRDDGFHEIRSVFYPVGISDVLEILPQSGSGGIELQVYGKNIEGRSDQNLIVNAFRAVEMHRHLPGLRARLHKQIPMGAGLGGGSSDATSTLLLLNSLLTEPLQLEELWTLAMGLGSDCPFFFHNTSMLVEGRGEKMKSIQLDLSSYYLAIVHPGVHVNTGWAYQQIKPKPPENDLLKIIHLPVEQWKGNLFNDFEEEVFKAYPKLYEIKQGLYQLGALYASMSGSGSAIFGLFDHRISLQNEFPQYFTWMDKLKTPDNKLYI